jgi:hypothetical protein
VGGGCAPRARRLITLLVRALGAAIMTVAAIQTVLMLMGSPALSPHAIFARALPERPDVVGAVLDTLAWLLVGLSGALIVRGSRRSEEWFARLSPPRDPMRLHRVFGLFLAAGLALHVVTWATGIPWPHRFSATVLLVGSVIWFANRPGRTGDRLRRMMLRVAPETHGRGLWGSDARRRLIQRIVAEGDPAALIHPDTHLIISACAIGTGNMLYFVNWLDPSPEFRERIAHAVGQVVPLATRRDRRGDGGLVRGAAGVRAGQARGRGAGGRRRVQQPAAPCRPRRRRGCDRGGAGLA